MPQTIVGDPNSIGTPEHVFDLDSLKSDTVDLSVVVRALSVKVAGDVKVTTVGGEAVVLTLPTGAQWSVYVKRVWSTGTTATGIQGYA